uniref:Spike protein n=2 Tax=Alphacoronavirus 1 TaxID=693997 RepID=A0A7T3V8U3_9ALPC|nr:spike protein [Canine coronavirus]
MKILLVLALFSVIRCEEEAKPDQQLPYFNTSFDNTRFEDNMYNFLKSWHIPPDTDTIIGGYLPYCGGTLNCGWFNIVGSQRSHQNAFTRLRYFDSSQEDIPNVHGVYFDVREYSSDNNIWDPQEQVGLAIVIHGSSHYDLFMYLADNVVAGSPSVSVKICHWTSGSINDTRWYANNSAGLDQGTTQDCVFNKLFSLDTKLTTTDFYGFQWTGDFVTIYLGGTTTRVWVDNTWDKVQVRLSSHWNSLTYGYYVQLVNKTTYYIYNNTAGTSTSRLQLTECRDSTGYCAGYSKNVFKPSPQGYIPEDFSFNNWFVLTNKSSVLEGSFLSNQPLLVKCVIPVPAFEAASQQFCFNNGYCGDVNLNGSVDVLRFNLNFTEDVVSNSGANMFTVNTTAGLELVISCYNQTMTRSLNILEDEAFIPFGVNDKPTYCYVHINNTAVKFIGSLPPSVREIAISKYGHFYINGYRYFSTFPINCVSFNLTAGGNFWTVTYTSYTDVLLNVKDANIKRLTYCDSPVNGIKCSQLTPDLNNGFYPVSPRSVGFVKKSVVVLPSFIYHSELNVSVTLGVKKSGYGQPIISYKSNFSISYSVNDNETEQFCISTNQFSVSLQVDCRSGIWSDNFDNACDNALYAEASITGGTCPFSFDKINNYLGFEKLCFSTVPTGSDCYFEVLGKTHFSSNVIGNLYVTYTFGTSILGVPTAYSGLADTSQLYLDQCTDYSIYGHTGTGIIRQTNSSVLTGLYYTSLSGDLLGFKNVSTGEVYSVVPCELSAQAAIINNNIVGAMTTVNSPLLGLNNYIVTPSFYYYSIYGYNNSRSTSVEVQCQPIITYSNIGVCDNGALVFVNITHADGDVQPISTGNVTIPTNFTISVQLEYLQVYTNPVSVDCARYVCNGNPRCNQLLTQYISACQTIEQALAMGARLENMEVDSMLFVSENALKLASVEAFNSTEHLDPIYKDWPNIGGSWLGGLKDILPSHNSNKRKFRSTIEDLLFDKVVTSGLGTVDEDYKRCTGGYDIADLVCAQYYNGIMVLPGVANDDKMTMYTASLAGGITLGALGGGAVAIPFAVAVQARLNYVALQTDVLNKNQQILANAFNQAIGNITQAFGKVNDAIHQTSKGLATVAKALAKVQDVVNTQGQALSHLTVQLQNNFQAISSSISDIYNRLDELSADAQVDRLITGRLTALNAFVSQTLTRQAEVRASRQLAKDKVNECVRSQSQRFGFCGNGTHLFSLANAAPNGMIFFHTVLLPTAYETVTAWSGICASDGDRTFGLVVKDVQLTLFRNFDEKFYLTPRTMYQPRVATSSDFVQIEGCDVLFVNATIIDLPSIIPDYIDINQTVQDILETYRPNWTVPELTLDIFNATYLNLTVEIDDLEFRSEKLHNTTVELAILIDNINNTLVNLEWLNRIETYVKWPWYVWLLIGLVVVFCIPLLLFCCCSTGCCGCIGCLGSCCHSICSRRQFENYEPIEKVHVH